MTTTPRYVRTVLVSDSPDFLRAACAWVDSERELILVATFRSGSASLVAVDVLRPDLVLIDVAMSGTDGVEATRRIKAHAKPPAVVLITRDDPAAIAQTARDAGADAVVSRRELGESAGGILQALGARAERLTSAGSSRRGDR